MKAGAALRQVSQSVKSAPSQIPKEAPCRSASRAARPGGKERGPTATVPPRSLAREAAASASDTAKYGVQATAICHRVATPAIPATGTPSASAIRKWSPSLAVRHCQPSTAA